MTSRVLVLIGTNKGAFVLESDLNRRDWSLRGPFCDTWPIHHVIADPATGTLYAAGGNRWVGIGLWQSTEQGTSWTRTGEDLALPDGSGSEPPGPDRADNKQDPLKTVWSLALHNGRLYAGVEPAGLFKSVDQGRTWQHVEGLQQHPSRPDWMPGGAGLILHSIVLHPSDPKKLWVGISAAGVFGTEDGGVTWHARNRGTRADFLPEDQRYPEHGQCVHSLVMASGMPDRLYQQNHCGMYRSDDGGRGWHSIEEGLPSSFGFPAAPHPRDPATLFLLPLNGDDAGRYVPEARAAVWRTRDAGRSWQDLRDGLPQKDCYFAVLRQALTTDTLDPAGVYFGTNTGSLFASADEGDRWTALAHHLPMILSVETVVMET